MCHAEPVDPLLFFGCAQVATIDRIMAIKAFAPNDTGFACAGCRYKAACKSWHCDQARVVSVAA